MEAFAGLELDHTTLDAQLAAVAAVPAPEDPWLARRTLAWGASEMPMVLAITGRRAVEALPKYAQDRIRVTNRTRGYPRLVAEKAGLVAPLKSGRAAHRGQEREVELLGTWTTHLRRREYAFELEATIDVESIAHASSAPREWMPLRARRSPHIAATPDAWCRDRRGALYDVELKCVTTDVYECRWIWVVQVQSQGMATGSEGAFVVAGPRWAREAARRDDGPVVRCFVEPDEAMRGELAEAAAEAWEMVETLRASLDS